MKRTPGLLATLKGKIWATCAALFFVCFSVAATIVGFSNPDADPTHATIGLAFFALFSILSFLISIIVLVVLFAGTRKKQKQEPPFRTEMLAETTMDQEKGEAWAKESIAEQESLVAMTEEKNASYSYYFHFILFAFGHALILWVALAIYVIVWSVFSLLGGDRGLVFVALAFSTLLLGITFFLSFFYPLMLKKNAERSLKDCAYLYLDRLIIFQVAEKKGNYQKARSTLFYEDVIEYRYRKDALLLKSKWNKKAVAFSIPLSNLDEKALSLLEEKFPKVKKQG